MRKLERHFKIAKASLKFNRNKQRATAWHYHIELPKKRISIGLICHEFAHRLAWFRYKKDCHHNKKYQYQCDRVVKYVKKKDYWNKSLEITQKI